MRLGSLARGLLDRLAAVGLDARPPLRAVRRRIAPSGQIPGLISVILPTRNRAGTIGRAVDSVLAQTYLNWELIIIDDGGTDDTPSVLRRYLADRRVRYYRRPARGAGAARNAGLRIARGDLIAYIDSDNDWVAGFLADMAETFADPAVRSAYGMLLREADGAAPDVLFEPFDREKLLEANFIDINVYMHRHDLFTRFGGFDETLRRLADWDLILRYTVESDAVAVAVAAANYRTDAPDRNTDRERFYPAYRAIRAKWRRVTQTLRPPKILYALWQYPQLSEAYIETEILAMRRLGAAVEVWAEAPPGAPYPAAVPVHTGTFREALEAARPDVVHVHGFSIAVQLVRDAHAAGVPVTVRGHGLGADGFLEQLLDHAAVRRIYLYPRQIAAAGLEHPKLRPTENAFNTALFQPCSTKNTRMVLRASAAPPAKNLELFLRLSVRLPSHRFVLCIVSCTPTDGYVEALLALRRELNAPVEILLNVPHQQIGALAGEAGIYLHTVARPDIGPGAALGVPGSIIEAMASGCYLLVENLPPLVDYVADAGAVYADIDDAERLIRETASWEPAEWEKAASRSVERAWTFFTGDDDFAMIYADWAGLMAQ